MLLRSNKHLAIGNCRGCHERFAEGVVRQYFKLWPSLDDEHVSVFAGQVDFPVSRDRRSAEPTTMMRNSLAIYFVSRLEVVAIENALVGQDVEVLTIK